MLIYPKLSLLMLCLSYNLLGMQKENAKVTLDNPKKEICFDNIGKKSYIERIRAISKEVIHIENWHKNPAIATYVLEQKRLEQLDLDDPFSKGICQPIAYLFGKEDTETSRIITDLINQIESQKTYTYNLSQVIGSVGYIVNKQLELKAYFNHDKKRQFKKDVKCSLHKLLEEKGVKYPEKSKDHESDPNPNIDVTFGGLALLNAELPKEATPYLISAAFIPVYFKFVLRAIASEYEYKRKWRLQ